MATEFIEIYELNEVIKNDNRLKNKPSNKLYQLYFTYLKKGISLFWRDCYNNLKNIVPFSQSEYLFQSDGVDNQFLLSPSPTVNENIYVGYARDLNTSYTEIPSSSFTFDKVSNVVTISPESNLNNNYYYIATYEIGSFIENLDYDVQDILSESMNIPFLEEQQNRTSLLNQMVYGENQKMYSQSQHILSVHTTAKDQEQKVLDMITKYSYKAAPDNLHGLGGIS